MVWAGTPVWVRFTPPVLSLRRVVDGYLPNGFGSIPDVALGWHRDTCVLAIGARSCAESIAPEFGHDSNIPRIKAGGI